MYKNLGKIVITCTVFLSICIFSFCKKSSGQEPTPPTPPAPPVDTGTYQLVWSDEFNGASIDGSVWNFETGGNGWGNHEQEYYQAANASIENGNLVITGKKEVVGTNNYTSARMTTQGKKEFLYGRIEARIKMPVGKGFWPAFWMLGSNINTVDWPASGEIDIMEHINDDSLIHGTGHWDDNGHVYKGDKIASSPSGYHVYSIEWTDKYIKWFVDGIQFYESDITSSAKSEFRHAYFILLNFALGGDWPGQTIDNSLLPAKMYVDYVRVYQKK
jgi:beta-glucanase (GH16 family)